MKCSMSFDFQLSDVSVHMALSCIHCEEINSPSASCKVLSACRCIGQSKPIPNHSWTTLLMNFYSLNKSLGGKHEIAGMVTLFARAVG